MPAMYGSFFYLPVVQPSVYMFNKGQRESLKWSQKLFGLKILYLQYLSCIKKSSWSKTACPKVYYKRVYI